MYEKLYRSVEIQDPYSPLKRPIFALVAQLVSDPEAAQYVRSFRMTKCDPFTEVSPWIHRGQDLTVISPERHLSKIIHNHEYQLEMLVTKMFPRPYRESKAFLEAMCFCTSVATTSNFFSALFLLPSLAELAIPNHLRLNFLKFLKGSVHWRIGRPVMLQRLHGVSTHPLPTNASINPPFLPLWKLTRIEFAGEWKGNHNSDSLHALLRFTGLPNLSQITVSDMTFPRTRRIRNLDMNTFTLYRTQLFEAVIMNARGPSFMNIETRCLVPNGVMALDYSQEQMCFHRSGEHADDSSTDKFKAIKSTMLHPDFQNSECHTMQPGLTDRLTITGHYTRVSLSLFLEPRIKRKRDKVSQKNCAILVGCKTSEGSDNHLTVEVFLKFARTGQNSNGKDK